MNLIEKLKAIQKDDKRSSTIYKNIIASFAIKGWSVLVQLMLVPLTLACLGVYENGVWLTISSVLLWIDNLDVGYDLIVFVFNYIKKFLIILRLLLHLHRICP
jgi:hypothetical protein